MVLSKRYGIMVIQDNSKYAVIEHSHTKYRRNVRLGEKYLHILMSEPIIFLKVKGKKCTSSLCSKKTLKKRLPCLKWIPEYNLQCLAGDFIAGLTVSLLIIPQGLAYGLVAGLTPNYGLYSSFLGGIVYFFLGSTKDLSIGPTAIMSLMTYQYSNQGGADYAILLCFLAGVIEIFAGIVNLGFFINFISHPVISGFTSAAAITIASSQLKGLFGLKIKTGGVVDTWVKVCRHIQETIWQDAVLGLSCIIILSGIKEKVNGLKLEGLEQKIKTKAHKFKI
ncbi:Sodium-independent sulfate anion transporter [Armadillidium vulgare]|nr:Sodium-independent sulfate anion transporter [Armadillidium vulgare]